MPSILKRIWKLTNQSDKRGVPTVISGQSNIVHLPFVGTMLLIIAVGCAVAPFFLAFDRGSFYGGIFITWFGMVPLFGMGGIWYLRLYAQCKRLWSAQQSCSKLGIQAADLQRIVEEQSILPRYHIDGQDYYDPDDFRDAMTLLRASLPPTYTPETLLRPAAYAETPPEQLLRAISEE